MSKTVLFTDKELRQLVERYMRDQKVTLYGQSFNIQSAISLAACVDWMTNEIISIIEQTTRYGVMKVADSSDGTTVPPRDRSNIPDSGEVRSGRTNPN